MDWWIDQLWNLPQLAIGKLTALCPIAEYYLWAFFRLSLEAATAPWWGIALAFSVVCLYVHIFYSWKYSYQFTPPRIDGVGYNVGHQGPLYPYKCYLGGIEELIYWGSYSLSAYMVTVTINGWMVSGDHYLPYLAFLIIPAFITCAYFFGRGTAWTMISKKRWDDLERTGVRQTTAGKDYHRILMERSDGLVLADPRTPMERLTEEVYGAHLWRFSYWQAPRLAFYILTPIVIFFDLRWLGCTFHDMPGWTQLGEFEQYYQVHYHAAVLSILYVMEYVDLSTNILIEKVAFESRKQFITYPKTFCVGPPPPLKDEELNVQVGPKVGGAYDPTAKRG